MKHKSVTNSPADKHEKGRPNSGGIGKKTKYGNYSTGSNRRGGKGGYKG